MGWIDGLNVKDVLRVVGVANIEIGIVRSIPMQVPTSGTSPP
jgi:hypothetical protein